MASKKISGCIVHGIKLPSACATRRTRHPEVLYKTPSLNSEMEDDCLKSEYLTIPPVPYYKDKWNVCKLPNKIHKYCPQQCICPPTTCPIPLLQRLRNLFQTLLKLGIFFGVIKVTDDFRIWSTSEETESLFFSVQEAFSPENSEGMSEPTLPGMGQVRYHIARKWNDGIIFIWSHLFGVHLATSKKNIDIPQNET